MPPTPKYEDPFSGYPWNIEPHVCRACGGRLLSYTEDSQLVRCSNCCAADTGGVKSLCACGALEAGAPVQLRCDFNEHQTAECPSEFIIVEVQPDRGAKPGANPARPTTPRGPTVLG